ncbi:MAG: glycyl-radical enzyme activating protein [Treponema sp.]|jgi:pyruvate formate lyase activating enzyme|nr:glycyl-radical enzyme activating protein [Treponema sp.]
MALTGILFNIQKFSLHDGPGIRTVVFFKGCPLGCRWCSNPESQEAKILILWDQAACVRCGNCAGACPVRAIALEDGTVTVNRAACTGCGNCAGACGAGALWPDARRYSLAEVLERCLQDRPFYEESSGGVTLSGGEALVQPDFAAALLRSLKAEGIHTALETSGHGPPDIFRTVTEAADLLLFDIKHYDGQRHAEGTGISRDRILDNLRRALAAGKNLLPRIPVIPGFNAGPEDAQGFVRFFKTLNLDRVQLLPFHQFGEKKYTLLNKPYTLKRVPPLHPEDLQEYRQIFLDAGIECFF